MARYRPTLVQKLLRVVEHPRFEPPKAWSVLSRFPPSEMMRQNTKPPATEWTHNSLYQSLYSKYPEVRMSPVALNLSHPSLARRFVSRQLALMRESGMTRRKAFGAVERELRGELGALKHESASGGFVGYIQGQEEASLQKAVKTLVARQAAMAAGPRR